MPRAVHNVKEWKLAAPLFFIYVLVVKSKMISLEFGGKGPGTANIIDFISKGDINKKCRLAALAISNAAKWFRDIGFSFFADMWRTSSAQSEQSSSLPKLGKWLQVGAGLSTAEAFSILHQELQKTKNVESSLPTVLLHYNAARGSDTWLDSEQLKSELHKAIKAALHEDESEAHDCHMEAQTEIVPPVPQQRSFYYIAAGVGCGIDLAVKVLLF